MNFSICLFISEVSEKGGAKLRNCTMPPLPSMQPPTKIIAMTTYTPLRQQLESLKSQVRAAMPTHRPPLRDADILRDLELKLKVWKSIMTPQEQRRGFTTAEVIVLAQLRGKHRPLPGDRLVGLALRAVGFVPCRDWTVAGRNRRYWKFQGE